MIRGKFGTTFRKLAGPPTAEQRYTSNIPFALPGDAPRDADESYVNKARRVPATIADSVFNNDSNYPSPQKLPIDAGAGYPRAFPAAVAAALAGLARHQGGRAGLVSALSGAAGGIGGGAFSSQVTDPNGADPMGKTLGDAALGAAGAHVARTVTTPGMLAGIKNNLDAHQKNLSNIHKALGNPSSRRGALSGAFPPEPYAGGLTPGNVANPATGVRGTGLRGDSEAAIARAVTQNPSLAHDPLLPPADNLQRTRARQNIGAIEVQNRLEPAIQRLRDESTSAGSWGGNSADPVAHAKQAPSAARTALTRAGLSAGAYGVSRLFSDPDTEENRDSISHKYGPSAAAAVAGAGPEIWEEGAKQVNKLLDPTKLPPLNRADTPDKLVKKYLGSHQLSPGSSAAIGATAAGIPEGLLGFGQQALDDANLSRVHGPSQDVDKKTDPTVLFKGRRGR